MITMNEARKIDNLVTGYGNEAIYSPTTSVVNPPVIMQHMVKEIKQMNPNFNLHLSTKYEQKLSTDPEKLNII